MSQLKEDQVATIVNKAVNSFNNLRSQSKPAFGASPNTMEDALAVFERKQPVIELINATNTKKGSEIPLLKGKAIEEYAGDWIAFFVDWKQQSQERHQEAIRQAISNKEQVIQVVVKQKQVIAQQNKALRQQLASITRKVTALEEEMLRKAQIERVDKERKKRRTGRERGPSQAAATYLEYQEALNSVDFITKNPFVAARERVCLFFLYISTNCLKVTVSHLQQMLEGDSFAISLINSKVTKHLTINVNKSVQDLILDRKVDIETICQEKEKNSLVITPKGKKQPLQP